MNGLLFKIKESPETRTNSSVGKHVERGGVLSINNRSVSEKSFFFCAETLTTTLRIKKKKNRKDAREEEEDRIIFAKMFSSPWTQKPLGNDVVFYSLVHACTHPGCNAWLRHLKYYLFIVKCPLL